MDGACPTIVELVCNDSVIDFRMSKAKWSVLPSVDRMILLYVKTEKCQYIAYTCEAQWLGIIKNDICSLMLLDFCYMQ